MPNARWVATRLLDGDPAIGAAVQNGELGELEHPGVRDCAVVALEDATWGERVGAAVVPADEETPLDPAALRAWALERLAPYKVPKEFVTVQEFPRTAAGKVQKHLLAAGETS